jgi:hypothetical protein
VTHLVRWQALAAGAPGVGGAAQALLLAVWTARILAWLTASGTLWLAGGLARGTARPAWRLAAVLVDLAGPVCGFLTRGLGRSHTSDSRRRPWRPSRWPSREAWRCDGSTSTAAPTPPSVIAVFGRLSPSRPVAVAALAALVAPPALAAATVVLAAVAWWDSRTWRAHPCA